MLNRFWLSLFIIKKNSATKKGTRINFENQQLTGELHKPIIRKFKKRKVHSSFNDNIWGIALVDMQLISKYNKGTQFLLCTIDVFSMHGLLF